MKSTRSVGCNHFEEMYVIRNLFRYVINPKERNIQPLWLDDIQFALRTDYIRLTAITYQSFGLDKNKALPKKCFIFCLSCTKKNWVKTEDFQPTTIKFLMYWRILAICDLFVLHFHKKHHRTVLKFLLFFHNLLFLLITNVPYMLFEDFYLKGV